MKKLKIYSILIAIVAIVNLCTFSSAASSNFNFSVLDESTATVKFGTKSYGERSVISKDLEKREITFQLKVVNEETSTKPTGEIMLVIDNSQSMIDENNKINGKLREELVINSAKNLITNLLKDNDSLKIGAVSFSTKSVTEEGSASDAQLVSKLTNNADDLISKVSSITYNGPRTDLDAGITLAKNYFSNDTDSAHKYVIVLTDGVPNVALGETNYYSDSVIAKTKATLQSLSSVTNNVFIMLTGITNGSSNSSRTADEITKNGEKTYDQIIEEIFGTTEKPTIGKFYYVTDSKIEETITQTIYNDLVPKTQSFKDFVLTDTFTKEIVDNFNFTYVKDPNFGTISDKIDTSTNSITWKIPELPSGETAIVQYKLTLKDNFDTSIIDKIVDTHSKLEITYTGNDTPISSTVTPKVKITENLPETVIPKAGKSLIILGISSILALAIIVWIRYNNFRKEIK